MESSQSLMDEEQDYLLILDACHHDFWKLKTIETKGLREKLEAEHAIRGDDLPELESQKKLIHETDWEVLIILDACRFDYFNLTLSN